MVRLATVRNSFHARVIAARLGSEGMVTELRGNVDGMYPVGEAYVFVAEDDYEAARELLLADEVESAFDGPNDDVDLRTPRELWILLAAVLVLAAILVSRSI